jgi:xyloglucan:xyloglucosyl transferase
MQISSGGDYHDEVDFEFLGNETGQPYTMHTNVYADGVGKKEMQFRPWFDPTDGYHNYTISWTPCAVVWYVDGVPIRVFRNYHQSDGVAFPATQPMYAYASIWSAEDWATQAGRVKTDWTKAPFVANYRDIQLDICECYGGDCVYRCAWQQQQHHYCGGLSDEERWKMQWVQDKQRIYNYCADYEDGKVPGVECSLPQY